MISSSSTSSTSDFVLEINPTGAPRRQRTFDWLHCPELRWRRAYLELIISVCAYDFPIKAIANEASQGQLVRVERGCVAVRLALRGLEINAHAQTLQGSPPNYGGSSWLIARGLVLSDFQGGVAFYDCVASSDGRSLQRVGRPKFNCIGYCKSRGHTFDRCEAAFLSKCRKRASLDYVAQTSFSLDILINSSHRSKSETMFRSTRSRSSTPDNPQIQHPAMIIIFSSCSKPRKSRWWNWTLPSKGFDFHHQIRKFCFPRSDGRYDDTALLMLACSIGL